MEDVFDSSFHCTKEKKRNIIKQIVPLIPGDNQVKVSYFSPLVEHQYKEKSVIVDLPVLTGDETSVTISALTKAFFNKINE